MPVPDHHPEIALSHILVGTDFSSAARKALGYATGLARHYSAELDIVNIIDFSMALANPKGPAPGLLEDLLCCSRALMAEQADDITGLRTRTEIREGMSPADDLLAAAQDFAADLVVLGTASKHRVQRLLLGSTAERVVREANCPVLTVGPCAPAVCQMPIAFQRIVCAVDLSKRASKAFDLALSLAEESRAHLYLCHVAGKKSGPTGDTCLHLRMEQMLGPASRDWCSPECFVEHGDAPAEILGLARRVKADLIVAGPRRGSPWLDYIALGTTPALLAKAECPVLTVC